MAPGIIIVLGRCVWTFASGSWRRESFEAGPGGTADSFARLEGILSGAPPRRWRLVFEPEALGHHAVETPKVSRSVFASLAKVRSEYPVVESETLAWGIECPESAQGGAYATLLHAEVTPGLARLRDACSRAGSRMEGAWPAYTAAVAAARASVPASNARFLLILADGFSAVATCVAGKRSFRAWVGPMSERDWKAFSSLVGDADTRLSSSMADPSLRRGSLAVIADGEPGELCPLWGELHGSGRVAAVMKMDALAAGVARLPAAHPANLTETFPVPRNLNGLFAGMVVFGFAAAVALGGLALRCRARIERERAATEARAAQLEGRLKSLGRNRDEMSRLRSETPPGLDARRVSWRDTLLGLSAAIPDSVTLTSLIVRRDNSLEIEAMVVGPGFDPEALRRVIEKMGVALAPSEGWAFSPTSGRLAIRGRLGEPGT